MWHPKKRIGGMCHYLLPTRGANADPVLEGRYGDEALFLLLREARQLGCRPKDFHYKIFGGADMFSNLPRGPNRNLPRCDSEAVGVRNIRQAHGLLEDMGVKALSEDVGGVCARAIMLDNWSGDVWVRSTYDVAPILNRELLLTA
jgi:chemotaxis protein CheD